MYPSTMELPRETSDYTQLKSEVALSLKNLESIISGYKTSFSQIISCICYATKVAHIKYIKAAWESKKYVKFN